MYETTLSFETRDDATIVHIRSEIDLANAATLRRYLDDVAGGDANVVVSLLGCPFIDSAGLAPLLELAARLGPRFAVVAARGTFARRVVELARLHERLGVHGDVETAVRACVRGTVAA